MNRGHILLMFLALLGGGGVARASQVPSPPPQGGRMTLAQLRQLAAQLGFPDPNVAAAIAMAESGGNPQAMNVVTQPGPGFGAERSIGLWQINTLAHPQFDQGRLFDPTYNGQAAYAISRGGTDWTPWTVFTSGKYRQYLGG